MLWFSVQSFLYKSARWVGTNKPETGEIKIFRENEVGYFFSKNLT